MENIDLRELKKGEVKQLLILSVNEFCPDFSFLHYKRNYYTFCRTRHYRTYLVHELLHIGFSYSEKLFAASVASRLNPDLINDSAYNSGLINPHSDLLVLVKKTTISLCQDTYYHFLEMNIGAITKTIKQILQDFIDEGIPYLNHQFERLHKNEIVSQGIDFISKLSYDKHQLKTDIEGTLKGSGYLIQSIKHPTFIQLKEHLQHIPGQDREHRKLIPKTSLELLELYWAS